MRTVQKKGIPQSEKMLDLKILQAQTSQETWDTMERPSLQLIDVEEDEAWVNSTENTFNKIIEENFPNQEGGTHQGTSVQNTR